MQVAVRILLLSVLSSFNLFFNHYTQCWLVDRDTFQEDSVNIQEDRDRFWKNEDRFQEGNGSSMDNEGRAARRVLCGRRPKVHGRARHSNNIFQEYDENGDEDLANSEIMGRIKGGQIELYGDVPWHANIVYENTTGDLIYTCGAAIISEFWLVTAASCMETGYRNVAAFYVLVGDHTTKPQDSSEGLYEIRSIHRHKNYIAYPIIEHDISLVFVSRGFNNTGIKFNDFVQPVCLPEETDDLRQIKSVTLSGIGDTGEGRNASELRYLKVMTESPIDCFYENVTYSKSEIFCFNNSGKSHICIGDAGAPVVKKYEDSFVLYGIVAFEGYRGCHTDRPTFVMNIYGYRRWLLDTIRRNSHGREAFIPPRA